MYYMYTLHLAVYIMYFDVGVTAQSFIHAFTLTSSTFNVFLATPEVWYASFVVGILRIVLSAMIVLNPYMSEFTQTLTHKRKDVPQATYH